MTKEIDQKKGWSQSYFNINIRSGEKNHNINHPKEDIFGMTTLDTYGRGVLTCTALGNDDQIAELSIYVWSWALIVDVCTNGDVLVTDIEIVINEYVSSIDILETIDYRNENFMITHRLQVLYLVPNLYIK